MADKREKRNEQPVWVDIAKHFIDQFGMDIGKKILDSIIPDNARAWLKENLSGIKGEALMGSVAIGAARAIPDSPYGVVLEEAIRELISSLKKFINENPDKASAENMPADIREKAESVRQAVELDRGLLAISAENARAIATWLSWLKEEYGVKIANKALLMLNRMPNGQLETFSLFRLEEKNAYLDAISFEEEKKPLPAPAPDGPSWVEKQRENMGEIIKAIDASRIQLEGAKKARRDKLSAAWKRVVGECVEVTDDQIEEETAEEQVILLDRPEVNQPGNQRIVTPITPPVKL